MKSFTTLLVLAFAGAAAAAPQATTTTTTSPTPTPSPPLCSPPGGLCSNVTLPGLPDILECCPGETCEPLLGIVPGLGTCS